MKIYADRNWRVSQVCVLLGVRTPLALLAGSPCAVTTLKLVNWSTRKLEPYKNQFSASQLSRPNSQEVSLGDSSTDQDRSGEQRPEPNQFTLFLLWLFLPQSSLSQLLAKFLSPVHHPERIWILPQPPTLPFLLIVEDSPSQITLLVLQYHLVGTDYLGF